MTLFLILLFTLIGSVFSLIGGILLLFKRKLAQTFSVHLVSFAAGVLLATAFLDLFPEALAEAGERNIFIPSLLAMVFFFFIERFILQLHHHDGAEVKGSTIPLVVVGDTLHNFIDGVAIAAAFLVDLKLGIFTSFAVAAHEIPQEIADFSIFLSSGMSSRRALAINFFSALAAIVGAVLTFFAAALLQPYLFFFLAFTGGMFIYISASDLIPEIHRSVERDTRWHQSGLFLLGIVVVYLFSQTFGV